MKRKVLDLKPTQFAVGMLEVEEKIAVVRGLKKKQVHKYIDENPIPVVISPHSEFYIVDHHHFLCVCYHTGIKKVKVKVVDDLSKSKMSYDQFWRWMLKNRNAYPFCQFGEGPRSSIYLPKDIRGLADDPYRSLAWFVRKSGAFDESSRNYAEFKWANFFREHRLLDRHGPRCMPMALKKAVKLAQSQSARRLPGYDKLNFKELAETLKKADKKSVEILKSEKL